MCECVCLWVCVRFWDEERHRQVKMTDWDRGSYQMIIFLSARWKLVTWLSVHPPVFLCTSQHLWQISPHLFTVKQLAVNPFESCGMQSEALHGSNWFRHVPQMLDWIGIWGVWRPVGCLELFAMFLGPFLSSSWTESQATLTLQWKALFKKVGWVSYEAVPLVLKLSSNPHVGYKNEEYIVMNLIQF